MKKTNSKGNTKPPSQTKTSIEFCVQMKSAPLSACSDYFRMALRIQPMTSITAVAPITQPNAVLNGVATLV